MTVTKGVVFQIMKIYIDEAVLGCFNKLADKQENGVFTIGGGIEIESMKSITHLSSLMG